MIGTIVTIVVIWFAIAAIIGPVIAHLIHGARDEWKKF